MIAARVAADERPVPNWLLVYGSGIVLAEVTLILIDIRVGASIHAALLVLLNAHNAFGRTPKDPQIPVLALLPLTRLLSLAMPVDAVSPAYWYALIGGPVLVAAILTARVIRLRPRRLGLGPPESPALQAAIAASGVVLGALLIGLGAPLGLRGIPSVIEAVIFTLVFVVLLEELIFRGMLQHTAMIRSPQLAALIPSVLYASMYLGAGPIVCLSMGAIGTVFGAAVARTGSLWGVIGAHFLMRMTVQFLG